MMSRNARLSTRDNWVTIDGITDPVDLWGVLLQYYQQHRGTDVDPVVGYVPRTTVGDVSMLAAIWTSQVTITVSVAFDYTDEVKRAIWDWSLYATRLLAWAQGRDQDEVYSNNGRFWTLTGELAIALQGGRLSSLRSDSWLWSGWW